MPTRRGFRLIASAALAWGTGGAIAALLYRGYGIGPVAVTFWRFALAAAALGSVRLVRRRPTQPRPGAAVPRWWAVVLTGVGLAVSQCAYFAAVDDAGVAAATVVTIGASPLFVAVGAHYALRERFGRRHGAVTAVAVLGLVLLTGGSISASGPAAPHAVLGIVVALGSAAAYSAVTVYARAGHGRGAPPGASVGVFVVGTVCLAPLAAPDLIAHRGSVPIIMAWLLFLGIVPTVLAYRWFFAGLATVPAATASVIVLLEPLSAAVIAVVALGEHLTVVETVGGVVLLAAVALLARAKPPHPAAGVPDAVLRASDPGASRH